MILKLKMVVREEDRRFNLPSKRWARLLFYTTSHEAVLLVMSHKK
jgi:hypothetical protein